MLVMLVILIIGITTALVTSLSSIAISNKRNQTTSDSLAQAKEALIGYAVTYGDTHPGETDGYLPCPDMDGTAGGTPVEGSSETCGSAGANSMGRLPWKTLDLPALYDGTQECLWYAVSGSYKNNPKSGATMNWDNEGQLKVYASDGNEISPKEIIAMVIAPGTPLNTNENRSGSAAPTCGGNYTPAAYMDNDTAHTINNGDIATGKFILPHDHRDANNNITLTVNDQFVFITRQDIWNAIQNRVTREAKQCLDAYASEPGAGGKYPWAVPVNTQTSFSPLFMGSYNTLFGRLPTRPNVQTVTTPAMIVDMQATFAELWTALSVFAASKTSGNLSAMQTKASAAKNAADTVKDFYNGQPLESPADNLKNAANDAKNNLTISSSSAAIANIQQNIVDAANDFVATMPSEFAQASGMPDTWPVSCTLFSSARWDHWRDLIFFQIASGYKPGSSANCGGSCLSVTGTAHTQSGSGSYRAAVITAGKKLTSNRNTATVSDYLEPDNLLPKNNPSQPYLTYRISDADYKTNNDHVFCLDGQVNCP